MATQIRFTSADLEAMPDDGKRYEIIDGDLLMSRQPGNEHQYVCSTINGKLFAWSEQAQLGEPYFAPGLIFADDDDVAPDVIWISNERRDIAYDPNGHFRVAPEVVIEVLSFGKANERRDREMKLKLYSRRGVDEYWIANWRTKQIEVFRRDNAALKLVATLNESDTLTSPLLPGFICEVASLFTHKKTSK
jgi:Uma2 family endonuclease